MSEDPSADLHRWIREAQAGSSEALGQALAACRFYMLMVADREMDQGLRAKAGPSDIVQETFLEAQRAFRQFTGSSEEELMAWLRRILVNNVADFRRRYRGTDKRNADREIAVDQGPSSYDWRGTFAADELTPSGEFVVQEDLIRLQQAMERLPDDYRLVLQYRYLEGLPFDDVAARIGRTSAATRKLFGRAIERLQNEMDDPHEC